MLTNWGKYYLHTHKYSNQAAVFAEWSGSHMHANPNHDQDLYANGYSYPDAKIHSHPYSDRDGNRNAHSNRH
jgi:hypothetical protein